MTFIHLFKAVRRVGSITAIIAIASRPWIYASDVPAVTLPAAAVTNNAVMPVMWLEKDSYDWGKRHAKVLELQKTLDPDIVLFGDSITHFWGGPPLAGHVNGPNAWADTFGSHRVLNMGFGWDRTQNVLWRLEHGEMDGPHPKVVVINIGTNNFSKTSNARENTPMEVAEAIAAIVDGVRQKSPSSRIVVMGVFPRGFSVDNPYRAKIRALNALLAAQLAGQPSTTFLDISDKFLSKDGTISPTILFDGTHPTEAGYAIWGKALVAAGVLR